MNSRTRTAVLLTLSLAALPLHAEDWPQFRGPTGQGISTETGLPVRWGSESGVEWRTPIQGQGWSSPIVFGERIYVTTATEEGRSFRLLCLDRSTGALLWDREVFQQSLESRLQQGNSYATPTPVADGQHVYVLAFDGSIAAVADDGRVAWTNRDYPYYGHHGLAVSPRLFGELLVVPFDGSSRGEDKLVGFQTPWDRSFLVALDKRDGTLRWRGSRGLSRIGHVTPNLVRHADGEVVVSGAGDVILDAQTGEVLGRLRVGGRHSASPIYAEGRIYFVSESGETTVVEATPELGVIATNTIPEHTQASMAVSGGRIILRTEKALYSLASR